jgi:hypothetical protein
MTLTFDDNFSVFVISLESAFSSVEGDVGSGGENSGLTHSAT